MKYVLYSKDEKDSSVGNQPLFWDKDSGAWVTLEHATVYDEELMLKFIDLLPFVGRFLALPE
jgi:hypothetical protein